MSKTFKSDNERDKTLGIDALDDRIRLEIEDRKHLIAIIIDNSQAAALALAILEAAGVKPVGYPGNSTITLGSVVGDLALVIAEQERATAEARERSELEAEALELVNDYRAAMGYQTVASFDGFSAERVKGWLAVARRARELTKEATK